jgi:hypothetical protein
MPEDAPVVWLDAARNAEERLARDAGDCGSVVIEVQHAGAVIIFATRDGRQATRSVRSADEILPTLQALLVTGPPPSAAAPNPMPAAAPAAALASPRDRVPVARAPEGSRAAASESGAHVVASALVGGRLGLPGPFISPPLSVRVSVLVARWELGIRAEYEPAFAWGGGAAPASFSLQRYSFGVTAGRREPLGPAAVGFGLTGGISAFDESGADSTGQPGSAAGISPAEPLLGVYASLLFPRRSPLRLRAELSSDVAVARLGRTLEIDPALPALPWSSVGTCLGMEGEIP